MVATLLGTGTPAPRPDRFSMGRPRSRPAPIEAGPEKLVFDMGRGVTMRLGQKRVPFGRIAAASHNIVVRDPRQK